MLVFYIKSREQALYGVLVGVLFGVFIVVALLCYIQVYTITLTLCSLASCYTLLDNLGTFTLYTMFCVLCFLVLYP